MDGTDGNGRPAKVVVVDSLNGYLHSMPEEKFLNAQLHELFTYLNHRGVSTVVTVTQSGIVGQMNTPVDTTYLADNVILFRYFEARGQVRRAISVFKKRSGSHENTIREVQLVSGKGIVVGEPLEAFQGVLTGVPAYVGSSEVNGAQTLPGARDGR